MNKNKKPQFSFQVILKVEGSYSMVEIILWNPPVHQRHLLATWLRRADAEKVGSQLATAESVERFDRRFRMMTNGFAPNPSWLSLSPCGNE